MSLIGRSKFLKDVRGLRQFVPFISFWSRARVSKGISDMPSAEYSPCLILTSLDVGTLLPFHSAFRWYIKDDRSTKVWLWTRNNFWSGSLPTQLEWERWIALEALILTNSIALIQENNQSLWRHLWDLRKLRDGAQIPYSILPMLKYVVLLLLFVWHFPWIRSAKAWNAERWSSQRSNTTKDALHVFDNFPTDIGGERPDDERQNEGRMLSVFLVLPVPCMKKNLIPCIVPVENFAAKTIRVWLSSVPHTTARHSRWATGWKTYYSRLLDMHALFTCSSPAYCFRFIAWQSGDYFSGMRWKGYWYCSAGIVEVKNMSRSVILFCSRNLGAIATPWKRSASNCDVNGNL